MITSEFKNMARNHMLLIANVKAAVFCAFKQQLGKKSNFTRDTDFKQ
jgi:hypothetical protein